MLRPRLIPCLLLKDEALVKTTKFQNPAYVGDPVNAMKIFNEKEVDEIIVLDIEATIKHKPINYKLLKDMTDECFMPFTYGGGIKTLEEAKEIFKIGIEKIALNSLIFNNPKEVRKIIECFGSQSVVASLDYITANNRKYGVYKGVPSTEDLSYYLNRIVQLGVGELMITNVDKEGTWEGFNLEFISNLSKKINKPIIVNGGCGCLDDIRGAFKSGASAVALGNMCVYQKKNCGVLINFPNRSLL